MSKNVHNQMGNFAEGSLAKKIQLGHIDPYKIFPKWTAAILSQTELDPGTPRIPVHLTEDDVRNTWRVTKENKAASPSGRYNATYKALCKDGEWITLLTHLMNIPFSIGVPYKRWSTFLDIMVFKKEDSIRIDSLRSIIISEGDWNAAGRVFVTRRMMAQAEKLLLLPEEHLGGRKKP